MYRITVSASRLTAYRVGVRVVLRDPPDPVALVPERRPAQVLGQERGDLGGGIGSGQVGHGSS